MSTPSSKVASVKRILSSHGLTVPDTEKEFFEIVSESDTEKRNEASLLSGELHVKAKRRRRGSFFKVGGLKKKSESITIKLQRKASKKAAKSDSAPSKVSSKAKVSPLDKQKYGHEEPVRLYCELCQLDFATKCKMETHMKFSTLHDMNLRKLAEEEERRNAKEVEAHVIFTGSKCFVRHRVKLNVRIFEQPITKYRDYPRIAILCQNVDTEEWYRMILVNGKLVHQCVEKEALLPTRQAIDVNVVTEATVVPMVEGDQNAFNQSIGDFLIRRVGYCHSSGVYMMKMKNDSYDTLEISGPCFIPGVASQPVRRQSLAEDFQKTSAELTNEQTRLKCARKNADSLMKKTRLAIDKFHLQFHSNKAIHRSPPTAFEVREKAHNKGKSIAQLHDPARTRSGIRSKFKLPPLREIGSKIFGS